LELSNSSTPETTSSGAVNDKTDPQDRREASSPIIDGRHESGRGEHAEPIQGSLMPIVKGLIDEWMVDTGASIDAVNQEMLSKQAKAQIKWFDEPEAYLTASGIVHIPGELKLHSEAVGEINAKLLQTDNSIISVGQRCMDSGFDFHWPPFTPPIFTRPDGKQFHCRVKHYVPYVSDEGGTLCPIAATEGPQHSSSSSSRAPARDESLLQPAKEDPASDKVALEAPERKEPKQEAEVKKGKNDDVPLLKLEATSLYHMMTHTHTHT
jgi:hypothetical protein